MSDWARKQIILNKQFADAHAAHVGRLNGHDVQIAQNAAAIQAVDTRVGGIDTRLSDIEEDFPVVRTTITLHQQAIANAEAAIEAGRRATNDVRGEVCAVDARVDVHETRLNDHDKLLADKPDMPTVIALSAAHGIVWAFVLYFGWLEQFGHTKKVTVDNVETSINYSWQIPATVAVCLGLVIALVTGVVLSLLLRKKVENPPNTTAAVPSTPEALTTDPAPPVNQTQQQLALPPAAPANNTQPANV